MHISPLTPAIVTGGASGLGAATARALAGRGAPVAILDLDVERGTRLAREIGGAFVRTDVTDDANVRDALGTVREANGPERICVNCAGIATSGRIAGSRGAHDPEILERTIAINLIGTLRVMSHSAAGMILTEPLADENGERGVVINTASVATYDGQIGQVAYAASKGGIAAATLPAARDLAGRGIRVLAIAPGIFDTPLLAGLPESVRASLASQIPEPARLGDPDEFAALACALIENPYMNGETIRIDGAIRMAPR